MTSMINPMLFWPSFVPRADDTPVQVKIGRHITEPAAYRLPGS